MRIRAAAANHTLSNLCADLRLAPKTDRAEGRPVYLPFYLSCFLLDGREELLVAVNAVTRKLEKEEAGIKIFVSGSQSLERSIAEDAVLSPKTPSIDIASEITRKIHGKKVQHLHTELVYFPGVSLRGRRRRFPWLGNQGLFVNLSSGTLHRLPVDRRCDTRRSVGGALFSSFESEAESKRRGLPGRSLPCLATERFVLWLIDGKKRRLHKELAVRKIFCAYKPYYIFRYYARRARALKRYEYCSVSATTGRWSNFAHKILEYDAPRSFGVVQEGHVTAVTEEVRLDRDEAGNVALRNLERLPGIISARLGGCEIIYLPLWTVHLEEADFDHVIEVCGVTGYVVSEESTPRESGG